MSEQNAAASAAPGRMRPWSVWTGPGIHVHRHEATTYVGLDDHLYTPQDMDWLRFHLGRLSGLKVYVK